MVIYKQPKEPLRSWSCKGCTDTIVIDGATYCRPMVMGGGIRTEWQGNTIVCLDKTEDK